MDWDLWLGPAPWRPYNHSYVQGGWRGYYDFDSGARLLDWGAHTLDLCQWANQADDTMPVEYQPTPTSVVAHYANGVKLVLDFLKTPFAERPGWIQNPGTCPVRFVGDEGWVEAGDSGGIEVSSAALKSELKTWRKVLPRAGSMCRLTHATFSTASSQAKTAANPQVMRHSHIACHTAALAWMLGGKLKLDPVREEFVGDPEANRLRSRAAGNHGALLADLRESHMAAEMIDRYRRWFEYEQDAHAKVWRPLIVCRRRNVPRQNSSRRSRYLLTSWLLVKSGSGALESPPPCQTACLPMSRMSILAGWRPTGSK